MQLFSRVQSLPTLKGDGGISAVTQQRAQTGRLNALGNCSAFRTSIRPLVGEAYYLWEEMGFNLLGDRDAFHTFRHSPVCEALNLLVEMKTFGRHATGGEFHPF